MCVVYWSEIHQLSTAEVRLPFYLHPVLKKSSLENEKTQNVVFNVIKFSDQISYSSWADELSQVNEQLTYAKSVSQKVKIQCSDWSRRLFPWKQAILTDLWGVLTDLQKSGAPH
jgi:hypothetical protein